MLEEIVAHAVTLLSRHLENSETIHVAVTNCRGIVEYCNDAFCGGLGVALDHVRGQELALFLTDPDAEFLRSRIAGGIAPPDEVLLLNFVDLHHNPFTLRCRLELYQEQFLLLGEPAYGAERRLDEELLRLNNQLVLLARDNAQRTIALEDSQRRLQAALADLETSHWHLRRIQEVLPICMVCGKVKTGDTAWEDVVEYLRKNALFLSHGYCPDCGMRAFAALERRQTSRD